MPMSGGIRFCERPRWVHLVGDFQRRAVIDCTGWEGIEHDRGQKALGKIRESKPGDGWASFGSSWTGCIDDCLNVPLAQPELLEWAGEHRAALLSSGRWNSMFPRRDGERRDQGHHDDWCT